MGGDTHGGGLGPPGAGRSAARGRVAAPGQLAHGGPEALHAAWLTGCSN